MLQQRRKGILEKVKAHRMVKALDLVKEYGVSVETIRRDLEYLESAGLLRRVYGGAVAHGLYGQEPNYSHREVVNYQEKVAIGIKAAQLIEDGDTVIFDVGTTALEVARNLKDKKDLTIITNATLIAHEMIQQQNSRVILLGGELRVGELSVSGHISDRNLKDFYANKLIMGVGGVTLENGYTDYHLQEANTRRCMIEQSDRVIAVADYSKFGVTAMNFVCGISRVDKLVTDWSTPDPVVRAFREKGTEVLVAEEPRTKESHI
ncbi:MAG: DeoR/GlpR family DNA-binding transcription regulator [Oscillospiraceae bacterium]